MIVVVEFRTLMEPRLRSGGRWRSNRTRFTLLVALRHLLMLLKPFLRAHRRLSEGLDG